MPDQDTVEFIASLIKTTVEDRSMTGWQKLKFIMWVFYVTTPHTPRFMF